MRFTTEVGQVFQTAGNFARITPDAKSLVYMGRQGGTYQLFRRSLEWAEATPLPGTDAGFNLFISPDSQWVGFSTLTHIKKVLLVGGPPVNVCECRNVRGASWGDDGYIVYGVAGSGLWRVAASGRVSPSRSRRHHWKQSTTDRPTSPMEKASCSPCGLPRLQNYLAAFEGTGIMEELRKKWMEDGSWIAALP